jgi:nitrite reductase (NADH) small subunit
MSLDSDDDDARTLQRPHPPLDKDNALSEWMKIGGLDEIPRLGARVVRSRVHGDIAVFRTADDNVFALRDRCPHKGGPLSQGIVFGDKVACPLHGWSICLGDGNAVAPDKGCAETFAAKVENGDVMLKV